MTHVVLVTVACMWLQRTVVRVRWQDERGQYAIINRYAMRGR